MLVSPTSHRRLIQSIVVRCGGYRGSPMAAIYSLRLIQAATRKRPPDLKHSTEGHSGMRQGYALSSHYSTQRLAGYQAPPDACYSEVNLTDLAGALN